MNCGRVLSGVAINIPKEEDFNEKIASLVNGSIGQIGGRARFVVLGVLPLAFVLMTFVT